jgi:anti-sigma factor RsiW
MSEDRYNDWDASYVIGALSADERREYERHLNECDACREQVADLAGLPSLLAMVPPAEAMARDADGAREADETAPRMPPARLPRLLAAARLQRRRSRALAVGAVTVAAGLAASLAVVLPGWTGGGPPIPAASQAVPSGPQKVPVEPPPATVALEQVVASALTADVTLHDHAWGTRIDSRCTYAATDYASSTTQAYAMFVTDRQGTEVKVATWLAGPGSTVEAVGTTLLHAPEIAVVDIRVVSTGEVLLQSRRGTG